MSLNQDFIDEAEIGRAILYANLKEHCNPNKQSTLTETAIPTATAAVLAKTEIPLEEVVEEMPPKKSQKIVFKKPKIEPSTCIELPSIADKVENTCTKENTSKIPDSSNE